MRTCFCRVLLNISLPKIMGAVSCSYFFLLNVLGLTGLLLGIFHSVYKKRTNCVKVLNFGKVKKSSIFKKSDKSGFIRPVRI